jgi:hypothetical protein
VICLRLLLFSTLNYDICQAYNNIDTFKKFKQWLNNFTNDTDYNIYQQLYRLILNYFLYTPFLIHFVFQLHLYILPVSFICWNSHRSSTSNSYWQTYCLNITNGYRLGVMVINATFNNILIISWRSVLLVENPEYPVKTTVLPQVTDKCFHTMFYREHLALSGILTHNVLYLYVQSM